MTANNIQRRWLAWLVILLSPLLFILLIEGGFRLAGAGKDLRLFIPVPEQPNYQMINPDVGERYFLAGHFRPETSADVWRETKNGNVRRIFVLGGSSAAGYPYLHNGAFSRSLREALKQRWPDYTFEVVNIGMTAVNSHTLLDLFPEIIAAQPDAVIIYAGHNEFYGALGAGSSQSPGSATLRSVFLHLVHWRSFQWLRQQISIQLTSQEGTLMRRMVREQSIALHSAVYDNVMDSYRTNLKQILTASANASIPILIGTLAANLRDQTPFISLTPQAESDAEQLRQQISALRRAATKGDTSVYAETLQWQEKYPEHAELAFMRGRIALHHGDTEEAWRWLSRARDLDALRFRASSEVNQIIDQLAGASHVIKVELEEHFRRQSADRLIGNELMLEHLHPNAKGYQLMATAFLGHLADGKLLNLPLNPELPKAAPLLLTPIDRIAAAYRIQLLRNDWPFVARKQPTVFSAPTTLHEIAKKHVEGKIGWEEMHVSAAQHYLQQGDSAAALAEFKTLQLETPINPSPYLFAARLYNSEQEFDKVITSLIPVLALRLDTNESSLAHTLLGIAFMQQNKIAKAKPHLQKAYELQPKNALLLANLIAATAQTGETKTAREYLAELKLLPQTAAEVKKLEKLIARAELNEVN
jgi:tetratricopeptide (TPR) repeat protein